jgi:hypothetical protein
MATFNSLKAAKGQLDINAAVTFANLPAAPTLGMIRVVSDGTETTVGAAANGGGSAKVLVWYNGSAWRIMGGTDT